MVDQNKLQEVKQFYEEKIKGWMLADLKKSIPIHTNFLTALGCLTYTEVIGIFLPSLDNETGREEEKRFYRCLFRLSSGGFLKKLDTFLKRESNKNLYSLRNSMAHKYFPIISKKQNNLVLFMPSMVACDGILPDKKLRAPPIFIDDGRIIIAYKNYINELEDAVEEFYKLTFIENNPDYQRAAINGIDIVSRGK